MASFESFLSIVKEFFKALGKGYTYNIRKNYYLIFGLLWGIPVPIVTLGIALYYRNLPPSLINIIAETLANPIQVFFLIHPVLFGVVFGAMGTVREDKEKQRLKFRQRLLEINQELKNKNKELMELDKLKDNFLSLVSHELLSPLTTVQGYITFLEQGKAGAIAQKQQEILTETCEQIEYLNSLIQGLIDISRIEAGKFEVELEPLDMKEVISKVINSFWQLVDQKDIVLTNELSGQIPLVFGDKKRITQVLINILGNAIKFTPGAGRITVRAEEKDKTVEFSVIDTGIGIPKDKIDKIFDKFYQADSARTRKYGGCGLGLAITKSIIELHGGKILVESEPSRGSKFFFELKKYAQAENDRILNFLSQNKRR